MSGERTRVAIDVTPLVGVRTGIATAVAEILRALGGLEASPVLVPYALSLRAREHSAELPPGTRFPPIPARVVLTMWQYADQPRIDRYLRPATVLHATNYLVPPSRLPTLVSVYDCSFVRYPELCTPEVRAFEPVLRRAVKRGVHLHTGSRFVAEELDEIFGPGLLRSGRVHVIPLGVPRIAVPESAPPDLASLVAGPPYVLSIGNLEPRKNLPHLVSAFGALAQEHPDVRLVLAGPDGPGRPAVDDSLRRLAEHTRSRVIITGAVSDAGRAALLAHARVLAYPSIYEGFGFPLLEAMSVGVPVVAARAGSIPEVALDAAVLVDPTDEPALTRALASFLTDDRLRDEYIARGHDQVARFSWATTARELAACYRSLA